MAKKAKPNVVVIERVGKLEFVNDRARRLGLSLSMEDELRIYDSAGTCLDMKECEIFMAVTRAGYRSGDRFKYKITVERKR